jgi:ribosomal protein L11
MPARLLSWGSNNGNIRLDQVQEIKEGKQTDTFKKHKSDAADNVCFSVIAKDRSLDFQVTSLIRTTFYS